MQVVSKWCVGIENGNWVVNAIKIDTGVISTECIKQDTAIVRIEYME